MNHTINSMVSLTMLFGVYMLPTIIAWLRGHRQEGAICVLNFFLGWTGLFWVISLAWAVTRPQVTSR